jgi:hypothetical protein
MFLLRPTFVEYLMSASSEIEWTEVLCTFTGPRKPFRKLAPITFRDGRTVVVSAGSACYAASFDPAWRAA